MKKKVLFVMESLRIGGAEKSLLTILSMFDYEKYDVDLMLFRHSGELMPFIPKEVSLLPLDKKFSVFDKNRKLSFLNYLIHGQFNAAWNSLLYLICVIISKIRKKSLYIGWNNQKNLFSKQEKNYDIAIAFLERRTIYYTADLVEAEKKIGFIHNDYGKYPYDYKEDARCFKYYDAIATVSEHCCDVLKDIFPEFSDRFIVVKNMVSKQIIEKQAEEPIFDFEKEKDALYIVSVGRLTPQKGFDNAIDVCKLLVDRKIKVIWYVIGEGEQRQELESKIKGLGLERSFILHGADVNPYRWMQMCDIYIQPSRFEGFGITVAEAKCLNKKIIAANIPEFEEQLYDYPNAKLANDADEYVKYIMELKNRKIEKYNRFNYEPLGILYKLFD